MDDMKVKKFEHNIVNFCIHVLMCFLPMFFYRQACLFNGPKMGFSPRRGDTLPR